MRPLSISVSEVKEMKAGAGQAAWAARNDVSMNPNLVRLKAGKTKITGSWLPALPQQERTQAIIGAVSKQALRTLPSLMLNALFP